MGPSEVQIGHGNSTEMMPTTISIETASALADNFIRQIPNCPPFDFNGRGIVICAGGAKYLSSAWVLIRLLRHLGCKLPVQVWYLGDEERDESWTSLVAPFGVECVDALEVCKLYPHSSLGGWELKPYAILFSPFQEVLLLDADNVPVRDPTYLFNSAEFKAAGAMFWPDGYRMLPQDNSWRAFGVDYRNERNFESGQILVDKARCWRALLLCNWYNEQSDFFYRIVYGDKDTFRFAWHRLDQPFAMPGKDMGVLASTLLQYDPEGMLIFQHRCADKWRLSGNRRIPGFQHEDMCLAFMDELRQQWRILQQIIAKLEPVDRQLIDDLAGCCFELTCVGHNHWPVQLRKDGFIHGWSPEMFLWWVEGGQIVLAGDDRRPTCRLARKDQFVWEGRSLLRPSKMFRLRISAAS